MVATGRLAVEQAPPASALQEFAKKPSSEPEETREDGAWRISRVATGKEGAAFTSGDWG